MNPVLLATIPGLIAGAGLALLLLNYAPRTIRAGDALTRLGEVSIPNATPAKALAGWDKAGAWVSRRAPGIPFFTAPTAELDLLEIPVAQFYADKLKMAAIGFCIPLGFAALLQIAGLSFPLPLLFCPILAFVFWIIPDSSVRTKAKEARREFTRFVTVYLQLVAVALLGNTTADAALMSAASVSDSWVFRRIRREYQAAELTRTSKWDALERLGVSVGVPALIDMARTMRLSEARVGLRAQLLPACDMLRAQVAASDKDAAERVTSKMDIPVFCTLIPIMALMIVPSVLQLTTL